MASRSRMFITRCALGLSLVSSCAPEAGPRASEPHESGGSGAAAGQGGTGQGGKGGQAATAGAPGDGAAGTGGSLFHADAAAGEAAQRDGGSATPDAVASAGRDAPAADASPLAAAGGPLAGIGAVELVAGGYMKLDSPVWRPREGFLVFTDLTRMKHYKLVPPKTIETYRDGAFRCSGGDEALYCSGPGGLSRTAAGSTTTEALADKFPDGSPLSLNDTVISRKGFLYFSNLKAPDPPGLGSFNVLEVATRTVRVLWDARMEMALPNPNGVALSPDEAFLYVGISAYDEKSRSGVYRFPIGADGTIDVAAGRAKKWAAVASPDGIAVDAAGNVYFTAGSVVHVHAPDGKSFGTIKIPKGSGTNLAFGDPDMKTLYITTNPELYKVRVSVAGTLP